MAFDISAITGAPQRLRHRAKVLAAFGQLWQSKLEVTGGTIPTSVWIDGKNFTVTTLALNADGTDQHETVQNAMANDTIVVVKPGGPYMLSGNYVRIEDKHDCYLVGYGARFEAIDRTNENDALSEYAGFRFSGCARHGILGVTGDMPDIPIDPSVAGNWTYSGGTYAIGRARHWRKYIKDLEKTAVATRGTDRNPAVSKDQSNSYAMWIFSEPLGGTNPSEFICVDNRMTGQRGSLRVSTCNGFVITGNRWAMTYSDCQHTDKGCQNGLIAGNSVFGSGDDGIPLVSYAIEDWPRAITNVIVEDNFIAWCRSRGMIAHGAKNCVFRRNFVTETNHSGIAIMAEEYNGKISYSNDNVGFIGNEFWRVSRSHNSVNNWYEWPISVTKADANHENTHCLIKDNIIHALDEPRAIDAISANGLTNAGNAIRIEGPAWSATPNDEGNAIEGTVIVDDLNRPDPA